MLCIDNNLTRQIVMENTTETPVIKPECEISNDRESAVVAQMEEGRKQGQIWQISSIFAPVTDISSEWKPT